MKVLEHGKNYEQVFCSNCDCKIGYTEIDIIEDVGIQKYLHCPECGREVRVG
jgi:DNA-directed RNA polymerase subunit RPC12/RpoP